MMTAMFVGDEHSNFFEQIYGTKFLKGARVDVEDNVGLRLQLDPRFNVSGEPGVAVKAAPALAAPVATVAPAHDEKKPAAGKVAASSGHSEGGGGYRRR